MNTPGKASLPVIKRLPKYYRYLRTLKNDGITSISSRELAAQMGTTASQVRQDFNCIGDVNGRQGIGYSVENLLNILEDLLFGNGDRLTTILIGCGRLGKACLLYTSPITKRECAKMLGKLWNLTAPSAPVTISDIPASDPDYGVIAAVVEAGMIELKDPTSAIAQGTLYLSLIHILRHKCGKHHCGGLWRQPERCHHFSRRKCSPEPQPSGTRLFGKHHRRAF